MSDYNPIRSVDGKSVKCPSGYQYSLSDLSDSSAGRTEDTLMHKNRIGQKVKIALEWRNVTYAECSAILKAFDPEYISVEYFDAKENGYRTKTFYVGDRSTPLYNARKGLWSNVAFNITER